MSSQTATVAKHRGDRHSTLGDDDLALGQLYLCSSNRFLASYQGASSVLCESMRYLSGGKTRGENSRSCWHCGRMAIQCEAFTVATRASPGLLRSPEVLRPRRV